VSIVKKEGDELDDSLISNYITSRKNECKRIQNTLL
jgi:hypothetical protein